MTTPLVPTLRVGIDAPSRITPLWAGVSHCTVGLHPGGSVNVVSGCIRTQVMVTTPFFRVAVQPGPVSCCVVSILLRATATTPYR